MSDLVEALRLEGDLRVCEKEMTFGNSKSREDRIADDLCHQAASRISQQDAELERMRSALRDICTAIEREPIVGDLDYPHAHNDWRGWRKKVLRPAAEKARAALAGESQT